MSINIDSLTLGQIRELNNIFGGQNKDAGLSEMIGKKVIIRTFSAGCWFGVLAQKSGNEVILSNARRMWRWWAKESISLSACAIYGVNHDKSKIVAPVPEIWLEAIEIIPCSEVAVASIEGSPHVSPE